MIHMVREFLPNGMPIMIDGVVEGDRVSPDSARIFPLSVGEDAPSVIGTPFYCFNDPDDLGKKIADRLTKVYRDSVDD
tara:strand:+ start:10304 stop:10537 length:234 start_codon:yes stop_codon:yes gene_type:complete